MEPEARTTPASSTPSAPPGTPRAWPGVVALTWGLGFVVLTFVEAVVRLGLRSIGLIEHRLGAVGWTLVLAGTVVMVYGEGHRALERRFVPALLARALRLARERRLRWRVLAPLYVLSLVGAERRALARAWMGVALIVLAVVVVRALPEPWRGGVDVAVAAALAWGLGALTVQLVRRRGELAAATREPPEARTGTT